MANSIYQQHKPVGGDDLYLKLKDGDKVRLRIVSEPAVTLYKEGDKVRYAWVVWNRELARPQVYNAGVSVFSQIADISQEWGEEPTEFDITIKRTGSGLQDTEYSVVPVKNSEELTKSQFDVVNKIDLLQATKGKWLADYVEDNTPPEPKVSGGQDEIVPMPDDKDAPINIEDIPF